MENMELNRIAALATHLGMPFEITDGEIIFLCEDEQGTYLAPERSFFKKINYNTFGVLESEEEYLVVTEDEALELVAEDAEESAREGVRLIESIMPALPDYINYQAFAKHVKSINAVGEFLNKYDSKEAYIEKYDLYIYRVN